jgi:hypothetical protein
MRQLKNRQMIDSSSHKIKKSTTTNANSTTIETPLPKRSVLDECYFINLVNIVNESWWKTLLVILIEMMMDHHNHYYNHYDIFFCCCYHFLD